jgi:predicted ATPase
MRVPGESPLLERAAELTALTGLIGSAAAGGRLVLVEGSPGIGKTRLVAEARRLGREAGLEVRGARATELELELAYGVVRQLFEALLVSGGPEQRARLLSGPATSAAAVLDAGRAGETAGAAVGDASFGTLHSLYWLTANVAAQAPLLLTIDDLHWCDYRSLRWLAYLLARLEDLPVIVVAGTRPPDRSPHADVLRQLRADALTTVLVPAPLSEAASTELIRQLLPASADAQFCRACHV